MSNQQLISELNIVKKSYDKYKNFSYNHPKGYLKSFYEGQIITLCHVLGLSTTEYLIQH